MRIGQGFNICKFGIGEKIVIGGVVIPWHRGLEAHWDGDVLLQVLCDALLGAAALGDIGRHFRDSDPQYANADSRALLRLVYTKVKGAGYILVNTDVTIIAQAPKMAPHIDNMRARIAQDLETEITNINIKTTISEALGLTRYEEGISVLANVLLEDHEQTILI